MSSISNQHIITNTELNISIGAVYHLSNNLINDRYYTDWATRNILLAFDHHADNLIAANSVVEIENLDIEIDVSIDDFFGNDTDDLQAVIWDKIYYELKNAIAVNNAAPISIENYETNRVLKFIDTGQLEIEVSTEQWSQSISLFFAEILINKNIRQNWFKTLQSKHAFNRFYSLKTDYIILQWINNLLGIDTVSKSLKVIYELICNNPNYFIMVSSVDFYHYFFKQIAIHRKAHFSNKSIKVLLKKMSSHYLKVDAVAITKLKYTAETEKFLNEIFNQSNLLKIASSNVNTEHDADIGNEELIEDGTQIFSAGLVLVAAFLPQLLKTLGYLNEQGAFQNKKEIPILLHYLITREKEVPEWKLTLAKVLSGLKPGEYCDTLIKPTKKMDREIYKFLEAIIKHWEALKNTSPEGLRETFLQREGVLKFKNGFYYLDIETKTEDILLNYVSWNYSTIKFNWMKNVLFVTWNKS